jgi:hypothetical protein
MREIQNKDWADFCQRLNQFENGGNVTIEVQTRNGASVEIARAVPLGEITFGKRNDCSDQISIHSRGEEKADHDIVEPIRILLKEAEGGQAFNPVLIEAEDGITTLTFHPVIRASWLEGLRLQ